MKIRRFVEPRSAASQLFEFRRAPRKPICDFLTIIPPRRYVWRIDRQTETHDNASDSRQKQAIDLLRVVIVRSLRRRGFRGTGPVILAETGRDECARDYILSPDLSRRRVLLCRRRTRRQGHVKSPAGLETSMDVV